MTAPVAIVAALADETVSLKSKPGGAGPIRIVQCGLGCERAANAARAALADGARALVSWGLVGALDGTLAAGDVILPRRVHRGGIVADVADDWRERFAVLGEEFRVTSGDLLTVDAPLESSAAKSAAAVASGCVAVDMEAAGVAAVAREAEVPFIAVRVVVDTFADRLPPAEHWIDDRGNRRRGAAWRALGRPAEWPALFTLAKRYRIASAMLNRLAQAAARRGLFDAPGFGALRVRD